MLSRLLKYRPAGTSLTFIGCVAVIVICTSVLVWQGCATAPPTLTPHAQVAWKATRVIKALDIVRDIAVDGNKTTPPAVSTDAMLKIVHWHRSAIIIANQAPTGWTTAITTSLTEVVKDLPPTDRKTIQPYVTLALEVLQEVL